jgi:hypothetical protein
MTRSPPALLDDPSRTSANARMSGGKRRHQKTTNKNEQSWRKSGRTKQTKQLGKTSRRTQRGGYSQLSQIPFSTQQHYYMLRAGPVANNMYNP